MKTIEETIAFLKERKRRLEKVIELAEMRDDRWMLVGSIGKENEVQGILDFIKGE